MRFPQNYQQKLQHLLHQFCFLQLAILNELFASCVFDFFEDLGAENELESGVDNGVDVIGVVLLAAMIEKDVDNFKAEELKVKKVGVAGGWGLFFLPANNPVDEGNKVVESIGQNQIIAVDS